MKNTCNLSKITLIISTGNLHKLDEIKFILNLIIPKDNLNILYKDIHVKETLPTSEKNAIAKAKACYEIVKDSVNFDFILSEDTTLNIDILDGWPGVQTKRVTGNTFEEKINFIISKLKQKDPNKTLFRANFKTTAILYKKETIYSFEGILNGFISTKPNFKNGFGYDPIFVLNDQKTYLSDLTYEQKCNISHRYLSIKKVGEFLKCYSKVHINI